MPRVETLDSEAKARRGTAALQILWLPAIALVVAILAAWLLKPTVEQILASPAVHDFDTKTRHARRFLSEGNKVKVTLMFRGRQIAHPELGRAVVERVAVSLADVSKIETDARLEGKALTMILTPK